MRTVEPPVRQGRHPHGDHQAGAASAQQSRPQGVARRRVDRETGARDLLQETLQHRRHVAEPERVDEDQVLRPGNRLLRGHDGRRCRTLPFFLAGQQRQVQQRRRDDLDDVAGAARALEIGALKRMAQVLVRAVGMPLHDQDPAPGALCAHQVLRGGCRASVISTVPSTLLASAKPQARASACMRALSPSATPRSSAKPRPRQ